MQVCVVTLVVLMAAGVVLSLPPALLPESPSAAGGEVTDLEDEHLSRQKRGCGGGGCHDSRESGGFSYEGGCGGGGCGGGFRDSFENGCAGGGCGGGGGGCGSGGCGGGSAASAQSSAFSSSSSTRWRRSPKKN